MSKIEDNIISCTYTGEKYNKTHEYFIAEKDFRCHFNPGYFILCKRIMRLKNMTGTQK